jgi:hypothetical protein
MQWAADMCLKDYQINSHIAMQQNIFKTTSNGMYDLKSLSNLLPPELTT